VAARAAAAAQLEALQREAQEASGHLAQLARAREAAEEAAQQARHDARLAQGEAAAAQVPREGGRGARGTSRHGRAALAAAAQSRRHCHPASPLKSPRLPASPPPRLPASLLACFPASPRAIHKEHLAQLRASVAEARARGEAGAEAAKQLACQLEEARGQLRAARSEAAEAVAEAEDARKECGRVLRELAGVHQVRRRGGRAAAMCACVSGAAGGLSLRAQGTSGCTCTCQRADARAACAALP
jgi:hypothetical protein